MNISVGNRCYLNDTVLSYGSEFLHVALSFQNNNKRCVRFPWPLHKACWKAFPQSLSERFLRVFDGKLSHSLCQKAFPPSLSESFLMVIVGRVYYS
jgi:hypothetical protein